MKVKIRYKNACSMLVKRTASRGSLGEITHEANKDNSTIDLSGLTIKE